MTDSPRRPWHKKSAGRYRTTIHRIAWAEVVRDARAGGWNVIGFCWPHPKHITRIAGPFATMREAKAAAEERLRAVTTRAGER